MCVLEWTNNTLKIENGQHKYLLLSNWPLNNFFVSSGTIIQVKKNHELLLSTYCILCFGKNTNLKAFIYFFVPSNIYSVYKHIVNGPSQHKVRKIEVILQMFKDQVFMEALKAIDQISRNSVEKCRGEIVEERHVTKNLYEMADMIFILFAPKLWFSRKIKGHTLWLVIWTAELAQANRMFTSSSILRF